tara:strand:- start:2438 stop:2806 length:369 start_codon:yes stop_codon:yes gene_type:complete
MKVVTKPWGKEIWLELNEKYCYKRIYINEGHRTSYQFHKKKVETNFIAEGDAIVFLAEGDDAPQRFEMSAGEFFTVHPFVKHRIVAKTNLILMEVSTPEVDDVVRLHDDSNRVNGRIASEHE